MSSALLSCFPSDQKSQKGDNPSSRSGVHGSSYFFILFQFFNCIYLCISLYQILSCGMWDLVPWPVIKPRALHWEDRALPIGPPGKFLVDFNWWKIAHMWKPACHRHTILYINIRGSTHSSLVLQMPHHTHRVSGMLRENEDGNVKHGGLKREHVKNLSQPKEVS